MSEQEQSLKHLFQQEFSRMVAVIGKLFGLQHIEIAEDIVGETFLQAAESWGVKGMPPNPVAWLYTVAKQKVLHQYRRNKIFTQKILPHLTANREAAEDHPAVDFSKENIRDSQLRMLFAICNPAIASEAQIGLALRILCGFGIDEISEAFLTGKDTINKRLFRAKEKLRQANVNLEMPGTAEIGSRLYNVLHVIYLLFNEGYYSKTKNQVLRKELCVEALRLGKMLTENRRTDLPATNALMALMCFHSSRFAAREAEGTGFILYGQQDENLWDKELIARGIRYLYKAAEGPEITSYHLEARIAFLHCEKSDTVEKWEEILGLYRQLLLVRYAPGVALNSIYALYKVSGREAAIAEAERLQVEDSVSYFLLLGELYKGIDDTRAKINLRKASSLSKTGPEREMIEQKIKDLEI